MITKQCCYEVVGIQGCDDSVNSILYLFMYVDSTVSFNISNYMVPEQVGTIQIAVILSNPLASNVDIQVTDGNNTASGK